MEYNLINIFNLAIVVIMLIPSAEFAIKYNVFANRCKNIAMNICEWLGRAACMLFMVVPFGVGEFGFSDVVTFLIYVAANVILLALYLIFWKMYIKRQNAFKALMLAVIPTAIFAVCGVTLKHYILIASAVVFGVGHLYVTMANNSADVHKVKAETIEKANKEQQKAETAAVEAKKE